MPIWLVLKASKPRFLLESPGPTFIVVACAIYWLLFPISLLSSLSATSAWVPLQWQLLRRLFRQAPAATVFYGMSGLLLAGTAWLLSMALFSNSFFWVPLTAPAGAAVFLIVGRLLGRLAWVVSRTRVPTRKRPSQAKRPRLERKIEIEDPWNVPEAETTPASKEEQPIILPGEEKPVEGYGFAEGPPPVPQIQARPMMETVPLANEPPPERHSEHGMNAGPHESDDEPVPDKPRSRIEAMLDEDTPPPPPPRYPLWSGVYTFPWYTTTLKAWIWLSLAGMAEGTLFRLMMSVRPDIMSDPPAGNV